MYIIYDKKNDGYAMYLPLEGYVFTILRKHATRFETKEKAKKILKEYYSHLKNFEIQEVNS